MCGRYAFYDIGKLGDRFGISETEIAELKDFLYERYNIGPSQIEPTVIRRDDARHLEAMRWGYLPVWAKDQKDVFKYKTFNARSEEIFNKRTWKDAIRQRRCLVPSNGFYEWRQTPTGKQPFFIKPKDQALFAFAGIYGYWKDVEGVEWGTYAILTTRPNREMERVHDRMPVIMKSANEGRWLDPVNVLPEDIADLLQPYADGMLEIYEVSREVNATRVDNETLVRPLNSR